MLLHGEWDDLPALPLRDLQKAYTVRLECMFMKNGNQKPAAAAGAAGLLVGKRCMIATKSYMVVLLHERGKALPCLSQCHLQLTL